MKSYYSLLLVVLCTAFIFQHSSSSELKSTQTLITFLAPKTYTMQISAISNIKAKDVGVGADGTIWIISDVQEGTDYAIYRQKPRSSTWEKISGQTGLRISVDPNGNAWVITSENKIWKYVGQPTWVQVPGSATDISCAPDGNVYQISTDYTYAYMLNKDGQTWKKISPAFGTAIAGGPYRSIMFVGFSSTNINFIGRSIPGQFDGFYPATRPADIATGANGQTWILMTGSAPDQFVIYDEPRQEFVKVPVSEYLTKSKQSFSNSPTVRIAVTPTGDLIGVREDLSMFKITFTYTI